MVSLIHNGKMPPAIVQRRARQLSLEAQILTNYALGNWLLPGQGGSRWRPQSSQLWLTRVTLRNHNRKKRKERELPETKSIQGDLWAVRAHIWGHQGAEEEDRVGTEAKQDPVVHLQEAHQPQS